MSSKMRELRDHMRGLAEVAVPFAVSMLSLVGAVAAAAGCVALVLIALAAVSFALAGFLGGPVWLTLWILT